MIDFTLRLQHQYEHGTSESYRRQKSQFFTPIEIARFMVNLVTDIPNECQLLDPGAGIGILTAAFCERLAKLPSPRHLTAYLFENDSRLIPLLEKNLESCAKVLNSTGHIFDYVIHEEDFVLASAPILNGQYTFDYKMRDVRFDIAIMNPPYYKERKDSIHARSLAKIVHGQPNIYAFFMALAARLLKDNGEMVAITPRSFCNGLYFRNFRRWYFNQVFLDHIHVFESRKEAFRHSKVLQENIISKVRKGAQPSPKITITSSRGRNFADNSGQTSACVEHVIDDSYGNYVIRIPETRNDRKIINLMESFSTRFTDVGLRISTGPVVLFRSTRYLMSDQCEKHSVPLIQQHNIKPFEIRWPIHKNGKFISFKLCEDSLRLLVPAKNYILLRRFSAKEEKRRLTAGCFFAAEYLYSHIGIENHVNYIFHVDRDLSNNETFGIAAILNSNLFDRYFRIISGNTQVNATEIRTFRFPDLNILRKIGTQVKQQPAESDDIVSRFFGIKSAYQECLVVS
jgi:adenine-specific DNA-methyltransferase